MTDFPEQQNVPRELAQDLARLAKRWSARTGRGSRNLCEDVSWEVAEHLSALGYDARVHAIEWRHMGEGAPALYHVLVLVYGDDEPLVVDMTANQFTRGSEALPVPYSPILEEWVEWLDAVYFGKKYDEPEHYDLSQRLCVR
jgi:hypothetical protein